ncbi:MAG TPA: sugar-binding transcriptional regulator [Casimicrobiaceae bacterium]|jgi:DNA-binding transcriptional regulator LsrR (DeoR family)|nr:sugar-binding transcriptional regulator [Casimicrobiaceae bacterium]
MSAVPNAVDDASPPDPMVRAAWLYYVEDLTQAQIARLMSVTRARVIALLAGARDAGLVRVHIDASASGQLALRQRLIAQYALRDAVVAPSASRTSHVAAMVGHAAGRFLSERLRDGMTVGIGWGATLHMALKAIEPRSRDRLAVVSLLGGTTHSRPMAPPAVARRLADMLRAECYQLTAPLVVADEANRAALWAEPALRDLRERARRVDLALLSVGDVSADATLFASDVLPRSAVRELASAGAVGDVLCRFVDAHGAAVDHALNRRMMAVDPADLAAVPEVVVASGGRAKAPALRGALKALRVTTLITDEAAASALLDG